MHRVIEDNSTGGGYAPPHSELFSITLTTLVFLCVQFQLLHKKWVTRRASQSDSDSVPLSPYEDWQHPGGATICHHTEGEILNESGSGTRGYDPHFLVRTSLMITGFTRAGWLSDFLSVYSQLGYLLGYITAINIIRYLLT